MSDSELACMAVAMASNSGPGYSSTLLGGRVPPHPAVRDTIDTEVEYRVKKVTEKFSECLHIVANEPSLALFRLQEHVRKSLPKLAQSKVDLTQLKQDVQGTCYDVDYATKTVRDMHSSQEPLSSIEALIKRAIASKKRLNVQAAENRSSKFLQKILHNTPSPVQAVKEWEVLDVGADGSRLRRSPIPFGTSPPRAPPSTISPSQSKPTTSTVEGRMPRSPAHKKSTSPAHKGTPPIKRSPGTLAPEKKDEEKSDPVTIPSKR
ncbi:BLOC-1-related complex subunit 8 homolog isoform X2 [Amphiura filiformis]|uniref:BLOC-1-related complex subunit 8 homolog isoform X2 n=1 Tax=Amphiura filiformis TaxID=82378 RepID=UPI003B216A07